MALKYQLIDYASSSGLCRPRVDFPVEKMAANTRYSVFFIVTSTTIVWIFIDLLLFFALDAVKWDTVTVVSDDSNSVKNVVKRHYKVRKLFPSRDFTSLNHVDNVRNLDKQFVEQGSLLSDRDRSAPIVVGVSDDARLREDVEHHFRQRNDRDANPRLRIGDRDSIHRQQLLPEKIRNMVHSPIILPTLQTQSLSEFETRHQYEEEKVSDGTRSTGSNVPVVGEEVLPSGVSNDSEHAPAMFMTILDYEASPPSVWGSPGAFGQGVRTEPSEAEKVRIGYKEASFNQFVSDKISLQRRLNDVRPKKCRENRYAYNKLPAVSVIICFVEESWSTLLRSVHSVLNRTPPNLLMEIILLDDASTREYLKKPLDDYMAKFEKVKVVRLKARHGLIRARLFAIKMSKSPVLVFLDSHIECSVGWLEPLLDRVWRNEKTVIQPVIDNINMNTFEYSPASETSRGTFSWSMEFNWEMTPVEDLNNRANKTVPISSPTIAGGLFAINKQFFQNLGLYDPGLDVWGVENLELSFKTWMCHGKLEIAPCSHVGHVFRNTQPYKFPGGASHVILHNAHRVAQTFLGPYLELFYHHYPSLRHAFDGDVTDRRMILARNRCHDFDWYMRNIASTMHVPELQPRASKTLRNLGINQCLDSNRDQNLILYPCHGMGGVQYFVLTRDGAVEQFDKCLYVGDFRGKGDLVYLTKCLKSSPAARWRHEQNGQMVESITGKCLDIGVNSTNVVLSTCADDSHTQKWAFDSYHILTQPETTAETDITPLNYERERASNI